MYHLTNKSSGCVIRPADFLITQIKMILYKFKTLDKFEQISDLLLTGRFYCPMPRELNDPLEGILGVSLLADGGAETGEEGFLRAARFWFASDEELAHYRLCAFSGSPDSILMWSYYGNGHSGICIEADVSEYEAMIEKVTYVNDLSSIDQKSVTDQMRYKLDCWAHENEYRVILGKDPANKYIKPIIKTVLVGGNIDSNYIRPLFKLCQMMRYPIEAVSFSTTGEFARLPLNNTYPW